MSNVVLSGAFKVLSYICFSLLLLICFKLFPGTFHKTLPYLSLSS